MRVFPVTSGVRSVYGRAMDAERRFAQRTSVNEMQADLADLAAAERTRASAPRHSPEWDDAVAAEEVVRLRIRRWVDPDVRAEA